MAREEKRVIALDEGIVVSDGLEEEEYAAE